MKGKTMTRQQRYHAMMEVANSAAARGKEIQGRDTSASHDPIEAGKRNRRVMDHAKFIHDEALGLAATHAAFA